MTIVLTLVFVAMVALVCSPYIYIALKKKHK